MVNIDIHRSTLIGILRAIYSDPYLRNSLGFKGGTAALLFYNLPRFSVDLDFDLLDSSKKEEVFERLKSILPPFGTILEAQDKKHTLFFLLSYTKGERSVKVEISKRVIKSAFEVKNLLGISMLVMKQDDMIAGKLAALLTRKKFASRDMYDLWFFLKEQWNINEEYLLEKSEYSLKDSLTRAQTLVENVKQSELLAGLGELLDSKQKSWVKEHLKSDLLFYLRLHESNILSKDK
ncbi:nucleotidyl transferase AbiEii/AbiGii toxin family protein [Candidatus Roizmanbacteria bacterium]|nr:nucleotidyl transferase AbiEii/AbiGii toxin family protein [Candidatus Roizmanbacteria bacterium]